MFLKKQTKNKWSRVQSVCVCVCSCHPCRAGVNPSVQRRCQVSALAAKVWHMAPTLLHHAILSRGMCVCTSADCMCVYVREEEPNVRARRCDSDKYAAPPEPLPTPTQTDSAVAILRATSTSLSPQGRRISHPLRSQEVLCLSLQVVQSLRNGGTRPKQMAMCSSSQF